MMYQDTPKFRRARTDDGAALIAYRGYLIRRNPISGLIWVEKDGQPICYPFSFDHARQEIDALLG
jgi:hypothetical protein